MIEKMKYSSRNGYSFEFRTPGSFVLKPEEVYILILLLKAQLPQAELDEHFTPEEQAVLHRYEKLIGNKRADLSLEYQEFKMLKKMKKELHQLLDLWMEFLPDGFQVFAEKVLGWVLPKPADSASVMDRMILRELKEERTDKQYFLNLLKKDYPGLGKPSPEVLAKLEERFGPMDLTSS